MSVIRASIVVKKQPTTEFMNEASRVGGILIAAQQRKVSKE